MSSPRAVAVKVIHFPGIASIEPVLKACEPISFRGWTDAGQGKAMSKSFGF